MIKILKNNNGIALMMVLVLLILVGGLTAALMSAGVFNIRFGGDEVDRTQSLYAADAGVEYTKNRLNNKDFNDIDEVIEFFAVFEDGYDNEFADGISFSVKVDDNGNDNNKIEFISTGRSQNGQVSEIKFGYNLSSDRAEDIGLIINRIFESNEKDDYIDFKGADGDFGKDNILLEELGSWYDFLSEKYFTDSNGEPKDPDGYMIYDRVKNYGDYEGDEEFIKGPSKDGGDDGDDVIGEDEDGNEYKYILNDDIGPKYDDLNDGTSSEDIDDDNRYHLTNENNFSGKNEVESLSDKEIVFSGDVDFELDIGGSGGAVIEDSIFIVDGSFNSTGGIHFKNSLVLIRDNAHFGGALELEESLLITFNEFIDDEEKAGVLGTPSITYTSPTDYSAWAGVDEILDGSGPLLFNFANDWRQIR